MFGKLGIWEMLDIGAIVLLIFGGRGKISAMMGDVAKGIKSFKKGMADDEPATPSGEAKTIEQQAAGKADAEKSKS